MLSAIFLVPETVMNLRQIFCASFWYQLLVRVSPVHRLKFTVQLLRLSGVCKNFLSYLSYHVCAFVTWFIKTQFKIMFKEHKSLPSAIFYNIRDTVHFIIIIIITCLRCVAVSAINCFPFHGSKTSLVQQFLRTLRFPELKQWWNTSMHQTCTKCMLQQHSK